MHYFMTSPEGDKFGGFGTSLPSTRRRPSSSRTASPFNAEDFCPQPRSAGPKNEYRFIPDGDGTRAEYTAVYASEEGLAQVLEMA